MWQEFQDKRAQMGYSPEVAQAVAQERLGAKIADSGGEGLRGAVGTMHSVMQMFSSRPPPKR